MESYLTPNHAAAERFRIGSYELRTPDYRQILLWAKALDVEPAGIIQRLESSVCERGDHWRLTFKVEDGSIVTLPWDFDLLPLSVFEWVDGLVIREVGFKGSPKAPPQISLRLQFLARLNCSAIELTELDLTNVPRLTDLQCHSNQLTALDLTNVQGLTMLWCHTNHFTELDLTNVTGLVQFSCSHNQLTKLDLSNVPALSELACSNNQLTVLDLSNVAGITHLSCENNQLTELDITNIVGLIELDCSGNRLSRLDLTNVPALRDLICSDNQLTELELSKVPGLIGLMCEKNRLTELDIRLLEKLTNFECDPVVTLKKPFRPSVGTDRAIAMKGWVYVITNKAMPGLIKIGYSMKDPELRATELNHTGSPHPYVVDYEVLVNEPRDVEQTVHGRLKNQREGKEWFRCTSEEAIAAIRVVVGTKAQVENYKRADRAKAEAIKQQKEAEERTQRAAEDERRKRESILDGKRQEIIARYEPSLKAAIPSTKFWSYFAGVFIALMIAFAMFVPKMKDSGMFMLSAIGAFIITPFLKGHFEARAKESPQYKSIISDRDGELSAIESERAKLR